MAKKARTSIRGNVLVGRSGRPKGVVLSMREFRRIASLLEDVADVAWMKAHTGEGRNAVHWEDVKQRLKERGVL